MAILTADQYFGAAKQPLNIRKTASIATIAANPSSLWNIAGNPGAGVLAVGNVASGIIFTDQTAGAPLINNFGAAVGTLGYLALAKYTGSVAGGLTLYDRIFGAGAVLANALATTNLAAQPVITGRLPGGNDYSALELLIEIVVAISATATTVAIGYTNELDQAGRTTGPISINGFAANRIIVMPLQAGDKACKKIDSITVGGVVATAGSFNALLARRLDIFNVRFANAFDAHAWDMTGSPEIFADSALWLVSQPDSTQSGTPDLQLEIING